jgi:hypothetical protein
MKWVLGLVHTSRYGTSPDWRCSFPWIQLTWEKEISDEFHSFHSTFTKPNNNDNKVLEPKEKHTKIVHFTKQKFTQRTQKNEVYPLYLICQEKSVFARRIKIYLRRQIHIYILFPRLIPHVVSVQDLSKNMLILQLLHAIFTGYIPNIWHRGHLIE